MSEVRFPLIVSGRKWERRAKIAAGLALARLFPAHAARLIDEGLPPNPGWIDWLFVAGLVHRHSRDGTADRLQKWHAWLWSGDEAVAFHRMAEERFATWWKGGHERIVPAMQELCRSLSLRHLCEIGCGSGLVLADLSGRLPEITQFTGLDLSEAQTTRNRLRYSAFPNLQFACGDATQWIPENVAPGTLLFTNAGVLEYLPPGPLKKLLADARQHLSPCAFAIVEPIYPGFDCHTALESEIGGGESSWSHPYPKLFSDAGFLVTQTELLTVSALPWILLTAKSPAPDLHENPKATQNSQTKAADESVKNL